jgi:signal peptidase II
MARATGGGDDLESPALDAAGPRAPTTPATGGPIGRAHWGLFGGLAVAVFVLDQLTKAWIAATIDPNQPMQVVGDLVRLIISHNTGALFGLFRDQAILFALASIAVIALIVVYHGRSGRNIILSVALGLLLGGAFGNLADRLRLGYVLDFVDAGIGDLRFYTFNLADSAISLSLLLLLLLAFRPSLGQPAARPRADAPRGSDG